MTNNLWYAVLQDRNDTDWRYSSSNKDLAILMANLTDSEIIAIVDGDECIGELFRGEDFQEVEKMVQDLKALCLKEMKKVQFTKQELGEKAYEIYTTLYSWTDFFVNKYGYYYLQRYGVYYELVAKNLEELIKYFYKEDRKVTGE